MTHTYMKILKCRHQNLDRQLTQEQNGILYIINCCDICADIALRSSGGFSEVQAPIQEKCAGEAS